MAEIRRALELDPLSLQINIDAGRILFYSRHYDQAIAHYRKALEMEPQFALTRSLLAAAYEANGMYDQALAGYRKMIPPAQARIARLYALTGKRREARKLLDEAKERKAPLDERAGLTMPMAVVHAALGENNQAIALLEQVYEQNAHPGPLTFAGVDPTWDSLRTEPRFQMLLRRLGLPHQAPEPSAQRGR